jgi:hypothetical protein
MTEIGRYGLRFGLPCRGFRIGNCAGLEGRKMQLADALLSTVKRARARTCERVRKRITRA